MSNNSFKSLADILNIDGSDGSFDDDEARKEKERQEEREANVKRIKTQIKELKKKGNDEEYKREMLKLIGSEGVEVLLHMKADIEDNPTARSAECFAAVLSAITNSVGELEKIDNNNKKHDVDLKKIAASTDNPSVINGNNNVVMVGSTNDLMDALQKNGVLKNNNEKTIDAKVVEESENDNDKNIEQVEKPPE